VEGQENKAKKVLYAFLKDAMKRHNLKTRIRQFFIRVMNIQNQWKTYLVQKQLHWERFNAHFHAQFTILGQRLKKLKKRTHMQEKVLEAVDSVGVA